MLAAPGRRARGRRARPRRRLPARVRVLRRPDPRRRRQQPGRADLLRRRQPAHPARARAGQPDGRPGRPGAPVRPGGRARGGGPVVLLQPRFRPDRHRARGVQPAARRCRRWLDDHAAVRQEHPRRRRGDAVAQVPGDGPRGQDLPGAQQGRDPRRLPQRDLLRAGRLRDPVGRPRLLRQVGDRAHPGRGRAARGVDPVTVALGPRAQPGQGRAALDLRPRRHGRPGLALPGRARRGRLPGDRAPQAVDGRDPGRRQGARRHGGPGRARGPGHHRAGAEPGRPADHHDGRPGPAAGGRRGGARGAGRAAGEPAQRDGGRRPGDRRGARLLRRRQRRRPGLRARPAAGGLDVQALRRARRRCARTRRSGSARPSTARPGRGCATPRAPSARGATSSRR